MARQIITHLVDDLDGTPATETVELEFGGKRYAIDLNDGNATRLRDTLAPFIDAARPVTNGKATRKRYPRNPNATAIREWAQAQGMDVNPRGRIAFHARDAYNAAH